jgi:mannitol/fructose-specific phosphotransferase system IIA component
MTKTVVIVMQEQNWEDDGGSHDPFVVTISDEDYEELRAVDMLERSGAHEELYERMNAGMIDPTYPLQIDDVLNIWYEF